MSVRPKVWLLVEDDENDVILFQRALRRADPSAQCQYVRDGHEAIEYLSGTGAFADRTRFPLPTVVLSDLKMPRCSGLELVQWFRRQPSLARIPFIILSSSEHQTDIGLAYEDGANWYLAKPTTFQDLVTMLGSLAESLAFSVWSTKEAERISESS